MTYARSRTSSMDSYRKYKDERVDPEGDDMELSEYAAVLARRNEEIRRKELQRRAAYNTGNLPPTPVHYPENLHSRRSHSVSNLRSPRSRPSFDEYDMEPKPLLHSKSASQSRASVRSLKRRAPQPPGPPARHMAMDGARTMPPLYAETTPRKERSTPRRNYSNADEFPPPPPPAYSHPHHHDNHYATPHHMYDPDLGSPVGNSDTEEMSILRPVKPPVAQKPKFSSRQYNSSRQAS